MKRMLIAVLLLCCTKGYAQDEMLQKFSNEVKKGTGTPIVAIGHIWPADALRSLNSARKALQEAFASLKRMKDRAEKEPTGKTKEYLDHLQKSIMELEKKIRGGANAEAELKDLVAEVKAIAKKLGDLETELVLQKDRNEYLEREMAAMRNTLNEVSSRKFGAEVVLSGAVNWGIELSKPDNLAGPLLVGAGLYLEKRLYVVRASANAGVNIATRKFAWMFMGSAERRISQCAAGLMTALTHDMGNFKGADKMMWTGGFIGRYYFTEDLSAWAAIGAGAYMKRGYNSEEPSNAFSLSGNGGLSYAAF